MAYYISIMRNQNFKIGNVFVILLVLAYFNCSSNIQRNESFGNLPMVSFPDIAQKTMQSKEDGASLYKKYCLACHQSDGSGVPGMYPPLKQSDWVNGNKTRLIKNILNGNTGSLVVNGKTYNQTMPPFNYLTDAQIAQLLTFVRSHFENTSGPINSTEVAALRK